MTEDRNEILTELRDFIRNSEESTKNILEELNWTLESAPKENQKANNWKKNNGRKGGNVNLEDPEYPFSFTLNNSINLNPAILNEILKSNSGRRSIPNKFSDAQTNFTREEKLAIYKHVVENTKKCIEPEITVSIPQDEEGISKSGRKELMTFAEIVSLKRDMKRRRLKYRVTKVPPLSYTEEIRNLIDLQMQALSQYSWKHSSDFQRPPAEELSGVCSSKSKKSESSHPETSIASKESKGLLNVSREEKDIQQETLNKSNTLHKKVRRHHSRSKERKKKRKHGKSRSSSSECQYDTSPSSGTQKKKHHRSSSKHGKRKKRKRSRNM